MNRLWLGVAILLLLLGIGIWITDGAGKTHREISHTLTDAAQAAAAGDWDNAGLLFTQAQQRWQRHRDSTAAIADHAPMEEIDRYFAQAEVYLQFHMQSDFCAYCRGISVLTQAVGEAQSVSWWSLL